ncbi:MAG TPA: TonB-dependent receptor, partial [Puia sp.]|nr:TonB-dependent receptor [Puia sp.]
MGKHVIFWLLLGISYATPSFSQSKTRGSVRGAVADSAANTAPLPNATVSIRPVGGDSTTAEYAVSNKQGAFLFRGLPVGRYFVLITYEGFAHVGRDVQITDSNANVDLGTFYLQHSNDLLEAAIVQRPPMGIKKDTVEYNAGSFAVKPNGTAEDLLNKMPGITVDHSGTVTAQGETVQRVMVNGKRFFSDDPKLATRNLPPDIIDKIQVFDDLSDQSKFTGFDDGNRVKTINIITKKNTNKGYFGKFVAAGGTNEDYDESLNLHRFDGNRQISLLGQGNDINKQNFTPQDIFGGGGGRRGGGPSASTSYQSNGVTTVWAGGANYRNTLGTNPNHSTDIYGSYFYNYQHVLQTQTDSSISPVPNDYGADSSLVSSGGNTAISRISSHRVFFNVESRIDSNNSIIFRPNITFERSTPNGSSFSTETDNHGNLVNSLIGHTSSENAGFQISNSNLQIRHRFAKPYRTISLDINTTANINNGSGYTYSVNNFYFPLKRVDTINQFYNDSVHAWTLTPTLSYTEPIAKDQILQFTYSHTYNTSTSINNTYDYVDLQKSYSHFDYLFSNSYKFKSNADNAGLYWRIQHPTYNLSVGSGIQWTNFTSINTTKDTTVARNYVNFTPSVNFHYNMSNTRHLRVFYRGSTGTPSPSQLQPLVTTSDSVNFQLGNPALKPQFTHSLRVLYADFDPSTQHVMFATVNASTIVNDIQNVSYYNKEGGKNSTYANLNGTWNVSAFFNYGFPLKHPKSNLNFMTNVQYSQSQTGLATDSASYLTGQF